MAPQIKRASKSQSKLRLGLFGPAGSGKTMTALRIASGMSDKVALIDTEHGSASKYADRWTFDVVELDNDQSIDAYCEAIKLIAKHGYDVLVIDSLSHAWQELLDEVDRIAKAKYKGNTWSAWSEGTPKQRKLISTILSYPGHIIVTMRSKTEWTTETGNNGKAAPKRVGLAPEQGKSIEYEMDMLIEISTEHIGNVIKDRTGRFQDKTIDRPGEEFGKALLEWLSEGEPRQDQHKVGIEYVNKLLEQLTEEQQQEAMNDITSTYGSSDIAALTTDQLRECARWLNKTYDTSK